jgi:hypothetical protein
MERDVRMKQVVPGKFVGHQGGNKWMAKQPEFIGKKTITPQNDSRMMIVAEKHPAIGRLNWTGKSTFRKRL